MLVKKDYLHCFAGHVTHGLTVILRQSAWEPADWIFFPFQAKDRFDGKVFQKTDPDLGHSEVQVAYHVFENFSCDLKMLQVTSIFLNCEVRVSVVAISEQFPNLTYFRRFVWKMAQDVS